MTCLSNGALLATTDRQKCSDLDPNQISGTQLNLSCGKYYCLPAAGLFGDMERKEQPILAA